MVKEVTRYIKPQVERELWARAAGRCEFNGCNRLLYKSPVTQEPVNIAEKAHIYSFSEDGPRGWGPLATNKTKLNDLNNLMLMCPDCHTLIDQDKKGLKYSADLLGKWKREHEQRIVLVSGIAPDKKSHVVFYGANIGEQKSPIQKMEAIEAMFPEHYPAEENPILLSMSCSHEDKSPEFWKTESEHLQRIFERYIMPKIEEARPAHYSLFAMAPMPLLILIGTLFTDKIDVDVYQPIREPKTWKWQDYPDGFEFIIKQPEAVDKAPVLVVSLSDQISYERITRILGNDVAIWELTVDKAFLHNDFMRSPAQLSIFRSTIRKLMVTIQQKHGNDIPLSIFPAMPISCAVEMGRSRMPKANMPWIIYDQNNKVGQFIKALEIGGLK